VKELLGWVNKVLWQMQMGFGLWQRCGGPISVLGQWGNSWMRGLAPSIGPGLTWGVKTVVDQIGEENPEAKK